MSRPADWAPLRGADPVPGDPAGVLALAQRWAGTADAVERAADGLRAVHAGTTHWRSASGRAFQERTGTTAARVARVQGRYAAGAEVLAGYAHTLAQVQDDADDARLRARRAQDDLEAAERVRRSTGTLQTLAAAATGLPGGPDPVEQRAAERADDARRRIARADADLSAAEAAWREAGRRAVAALDEVADDGLDDRFEAALAVVEDRTGRFSTVSAAAGLAGLVPGVNVVALPVAAATGAAAVLGTAVLWANDRASAGQVAAALISPVAGVVGRASRLGPLPDDAVRALTGRPATGRRPGRPGGPVGRPDGEPRTGSAAAGRGGPGDVAGPRAPAAGGPAPTGAAPQPRPAPAARPAQPSGATTPGRPGRPAPAPGPAGPDAAAAAGAAARRPPTRTGRLADGVGATADATTLSGPAVGVAQARSGR